jgi:hypothetical protein
LGFAFGDLSVESDDMPQPYRGATNAYFAASILLDRPELGGRIVAISALWTVIEDLWGAILGIIVGIDKADVGIAIYHALTGTASQRSVLNEMADLYLPQELKADFEALMRVSKSRANERNDIVHGLWFYDPKHPDALILAPRHAFSTLFAGMFKRIAAARQPGSSPTDFADLEKGRWLIYQQKDFVSTVGRLTAFAADLDRFFDQVKLARGYPVTGLPAPPPLSEPYEGPR